LQKEESFYKDEDFMIEEVKNIENDIHFLINKFYNLQNNNFDKNNPKIKLHEPTFGAEEVISVVDTLLSGNVTMGKKVLNFENDLNNYFNIKNSVTNNSGSSANLLAISTLCNHMTINKLNPGDEVIVPSLSWSTTVWPLIQNNLVPVFVDIDIETLNINTDSIVRAITEKTKAIMIVPVYGNPCNMNEIMNICKDFKLQLIEDTCESLGAKYEDRFLGTFGRVATYSFYFSHHITTLEGGVTITNDDELAEIMRMLRAHGWLRELKKPKKYFDQYPEIDKKFLFTNIGFNIRLTEIQGAMGSIQLKKLDDFVEKRRSVASKLINGLNKYSNILSFQKETPNSKHSWFGFPILIKDKRLQMSVIRNFLENKGIETRPIICGNITEQPVLRHYKYRKGDNLKNASNVMKNGFAIASHQNLDDNAVTYLLDTFNDFFDNYIL